MKKLTFQLALSALLIIPTVSMAQEAITTAGNYFKAGGNSLEWSLGQELTETFISESYMLTQGLHQGTLLIVSIQDFYAEATTVKVFPNPVTDILNLEIQELHEDNLRWYLFNIQGKLLESGDIRSASSSINMQSLDSGIYILSIENHSRLIKSLRILKK